MRAIIKLLLVFCSILIVSNAAQAERVKLYLWHSLAGGSYVGLKNIVEGFNQSQNQYEVIAIYKGDYDETLTALVAAYRSHRQPIMSQVYEIGTGTMMAEQQAIVPAYQLMQEFGFSLAKIDFLPAIQAYYSNSQGQLMSLPFNASTPVLYYNKAEFEKAGLDPNNPPKTWPQIAEDGKKLLASGVACAYTTSWPAWIQLEVFTAWHNVPFASNNNGMDGYNTVALYNNDLVVKHIQTLADWQRTGLFEYGGRADNAESLFTSGHCAMMTESSGTRTNLMADTNFSVGVATLPYWPDVKGAPQNAIIGGGSIWTLQGHPPQEYKGVAEFFNYILQPEVQMKWQADTGYLPLTKSAYQLSIQEKYYEKTPGADIAIKQLINKTPTAYSRGIRLGNFSQIRDINETALEAVFTGQETAKQALDGAVKQADKLLHRFAEMAGG